MKEAWTLTYESEPEPDTDAQRALKDAHALLTKLGVPDARGTACDRDDCTCLLTHRIYTLYEMGKG